jgi:hypothetical protein
MAVPTLAASAWSELWATATAAGRQTGLGWLVCLRVALPVEFGIWRIDGGLRTVPFIKLGDESRLEDILLRDVSVLVRDVSVLALDVMVVGRQVATSYGKRIDFLAIGAGAIFTRSNSSGTALPARWSPSYSITAPGSRTSATPSPPCSVSITMARAWKRSSRTVQ